MLKKSSIYLGALLLISFCISTAVNAFDLYKNEEELRSLIVKSARQFVGVKYVFGGNSIAKGLDCSSFVQKVYSFYGIQLPRNTRLQFVHGEAISDIESVKPGDLLFFSKNGKTPSHVGIVSDRPNFFIHARRGKGKGVEEARYDTPYYQKRFLGAVKMLIESPAVDLSKIEEEEFVGPEDTL